MNNEHAKFFVRNPPPYSRKVAMQFLERGFERERGWAAVVQLRKMLKDGKMKLTR